MNYESSNIETFLVQIPTRVARFATTCCPNGGIGALQVISSGNVVDCAGGVASDGNPDCGVYENFTYDLLDQNGGRIMDGYTISEVLSNFSENGGATEGKAVTGLAIAAGAPFSDVQALYNDSPACPGANTNYSLDQTFIATVQGGHGYPLTTEVQISGGYFSGTPAINSTIINP